jgi:hypothetical protein
MSADGFLPIGQQKRKKRAVVKFEYFRWDVNQGVPYRLHESLDGELLRAATQRSNAFIPIEPVALVGVRAC